MSTTKRRRGDRFDGTLIRDLDALHFVTGVLYPNRCDNEAYISECIDLTAINAYLKAKNSIERDLPYTLFHVILAALMKTVYLRPKLNRFIVNGNFYQRNDISAAFIVKKKFSDNGGEGLAKVKISGDDTIDTIHADILRQISGCRSDKGGSTDQSMDIVNKIPRWISKTFIRFVMFLDRHGKVPKAFIADDPYYCTTVISNLGSIKLHSGYHHLTNWGTCSLFCIIGEKQKKPFYDENGDFSLRETLDLGLTIDERLADGYYYSKSIRLLRYLLEHPEELEKSIETEVIYE